MSNTTKDSQGFQKGAGNPDVDHEPIPLWKLLLITHDHNQSFQPTIEECEELLEFDAELLAENGELDEIKQMLAYHLMLCAPYMEQLEDWSKKLIVLMEVHSSHS
jgi:hypothetical protein